MPALPMALEQGDRPSKSPAVTRPDESRSKYVRIIEDLEPIRQRRAPIDRRLDGHAEKQETFTERRVRRSWFTHLPPIERVGQTAHPSPAAHRICRRSHVAGGSALVTVGDQARRGSLSPAT